MNKESKFVESAKRIIDKTGFGLWEWYPKTNTLQYNQFINDTLGYKEGEFPNNLRIWQTLILSDDYPDTKKHVLNCKNGETESFITEFRMRKKDGNIIWVQVKGYAAEHDSEGCVERLEGVLQDITAIREAEFNFRAKTLRMSFVSGLSGFGIWDYNLNTGEVEFNDEFLAMLGYTRGEIQGNINAWNKLNHPQDRIAAEAALKDHINGLTDSYFCEVRLKHKDGHYIWTRDAGKVCEWNIDGSAKRVLGVQINIDQAKRDEERLQIALKSIERHNETLQQEIQAGIDNLRLAENTRQLMFDANPHICMIFDQKQKLIDCNPAAVEFFKYKDKEALVQNLVAMLNKTKSQRSPDSFVGDKLRKDLTQALKHGYHASETEVLIGSEYVPTSNIIRRIDYLDGYAVAIYTTDLRGIRNAEKETQKRDRLLSAINKVASMLLSTNDKFDEVVYNCLEILGSSINADRAFVWENHLVDGMMCSTQLYEWSKGAPPQQGNKFTVARPLDEVMPSWKSLLAKDKCINSHVKDMLPEERAQLEPQGIISLLIVPIFLNNNFWGFIGFDECKTERVFKGYEENLLRSAGMLLAAAMQRNEIVVNLIAAREEALSSTKAKGLFLANMSHEIRTPMNAIIGMTMVAMNADDKDKLRGYLGKIENASRHLLGIINDILDMSKIQANKLELVPELFHLNALIANVNSIIKTRADEKNQNYIVHVNDNIPLNLIGDEMRLFQVLTNLLSNAVKFTPVYGEVRLDVTPEDVSANYVKIHFVVTDNGIGMNPDQLANLFHAFEQTDRNITKRFGGTGLGLAISQNIVTRMGGIIEVQSQQGKGSRFSFSLTLPRAKDFQSKAKETTFEANFEGQVALLVEDIDINREIVLALMQDTNLVIDCAENGQVAVEVVEKNPNRYSVIYMDIQMPVMDGLEATKQIRSLGIGNVATVPIIAMTANAFAEDVAKCKECGMNDHISKPINIDLLLRKTAQYIKAK